MIFQNNKTSSQPKKSRSSKSRKIDIFPYWLTHSFGSKMVIFPNLFLGNIGQENVFYDIQEQRNAFLGYKNKKFKIDNFSKGVNPWFWSKNGHFSDCFFQPIQARKISIMIFQSEETLFQAIKSRSSKSRKIDIFLKG